QADAPQPAEPARPRGQDTTAAATLARSYAAAKLNENPSAGLLTPKSAPAPSANRYAATPKLSTPALSSSMQRAQNAAAAAAATTATTTATTPAAPGVDPSWGPSATPAQQARNIKQTRQFTEQQRAAKANANAAAARTRQTVKDYLGKPQSSRTPATATRRPHVTIPQGIPQDGTWLDSVQAQTGYTLNPAGYEYEHKGKLKIIDPKNPSIINRALNSFWNWAEKDKQNNLTDPRNNPHGMAVSTEAMKAAIASVAMRDAGKALSTFGDLNPTPVGKALAPSTGPIGSMMEDVGDKQIRDFLDPNWVAKTKQKLEQKNRR
ncbi:MAG: hypothetical protein NUV50_10910, partial [Rhodospirillales bacterium]|nr:hypothetical protein [Rhodospirillales bacterium]